MVKIILSITPLIWQVALGAYLVGQVDLKWDIDKALGKPTVEAVCEEPASTRGAKKAATCIKTAMGLLRDGYYRHFSEFLNAQRAIIKDQSPRDPCPEKDDIIETLSNVFSAPSLPEVMKIEILQAYLHYHGQRYTDLKEILGGLYASSKCSWDDFEQNQDNNNMCFLLERLLLEEFLPEIKTISQDASFNKLLPIATQANALYQAHTTDGKGEVKGPFKVDAGGVTNKDRLALIDRFVRNGHLPALGTYLKRLSGIPELDTSFYIEERLLLEAMETRDYGFIDSVYDALMKVLGAAPRDKSQLLKATREALLKSEAYQMVIESHLTRAIGEQALLEYLTTAALHPDRAFGYQMAELAIVTLNIGDDALFAKVLKRIRAVRPLALLVGSSMFDFKRMKDLRGIAAVVDEITSNQDQNIPPERIDELLAGMAFLRESEVGPLAYQLYYEILTKSAKPETLESLMKALFEQKPFTEDAHFSSNLVFINMITDYLRDDVDKRVSPVDVNLLPIICANDRCHGIITRILSYYHIRIFQDPVAAPDQTDFSRKFSSKTPKKDTTPRGQLTAILTNLTKILEKMTQSNDPGPSKDLVERLSSIPTASYCKVDDPMKPGLFDHEVTQKMFVFSMAEALRIVSHPQMSGFIPKIYAFYSHSMVAEATATEETSKDNAYLSHLLIMALERDSLWAACRIITMAPASFNHTPGFKLFIGRLLWTAGPFKSDLKSISLATRHGPRLMGFTGGSQNALALQLLFIACQKYRCPLPRSDLHLDTDPFTGAIIVDEIMAISAITPETIDRDSKEPTKLVNPKPESFPEEMLQFMREILAEDSAVGAKEKNIILANAVSVFTSFMNANYDDDLKPFIAKPSK